MGKRYENYLSKKFTIDIYDKKKNKQRKFCK